MEKSFSDFWEREQFKIIAESIKSDPSPENIAFWIVKHTGDTLNRLGEVLNRLP